jgi:hypothetical protein
LWSEFNTATVHQGYLERRMRLPITILMAISPSGVHLLRLDTQPNSWRVDIPVRGPRHLMEIGGAWRKDWVIWSRWCHLAEKERICR